MKGQPQLQIVAPGASPEEVAAITAALAQFLSDTTPTAQEQAETPLGPWKRAALEEGVSRQPPLLHER